MVDADFITALVQRLQEEGYEPREYSGRGMFGERCIGVDLSGSGQLFKLGIDLLNSAEGAELLHGPEGWRLESVSTDSMGLGVIAYWPSVVLPEDYGLPITREMLNEAFEEGYGPAYPRAAELACISDDDLRKGMDHCIRKVEGALEEEMGNGR